MQVLKGVHGGIREVALKMLLDVEDPQSELERFTKARIMALSLTCLALRQYSTVMQKQICCLQLCKDDPDV